MQYTYMNKLPLRGDVDALVVPLAEAAVKRLPPAIVAIDDALGGLLRRALETGDFTGEEHAMCMLYSTNEEMPKRILLVGTGKPKDRTLLEWEHIVGTAARALMGAKVTQWALVLPPDFLSLGAEELGCATAKGILVSTYHFAEYKSDPAARLPVPERIVVGPFLVPQQRTFSRGITEGQTIGDAMNWMRRFGDMPSSDATPTFLAECAQKLAATDKRFRVHVIDRAEMEKLGMGALLGVSRGAVTPPACIVLEWKGNPRAPKEWYAFVGKGITFDSGGISIKPREKMDEMKFDMSGGAAVLGALKAIAALGVRTNIVGVVPACDNLPSGSAYKPGDILKTCRGKTIEVQDTDAEGRVVLADAFGYVQRYEPKVIVDLATLTGACIVALGFQYSGLFANDDRLCRRIESASEVSGDRVWRLPLGDAFTRDVKSDIADWANVGKSGRYGGASNAAAFLEQFAEGVPWAHLDIAGPAMPPEPTPWRGKGATGVGVHLLVELARSWVR